LCSPVCVLTPPLRSRFLPRFLSSSLHSPPSRSPLLLFSLLALAKLK
jgi:hypothetical protein